MQEDSRPQRGDKILVVISEGGEDPLDANDCLAEVGQYYYIVSDGSYSAYVSETRNGPTIPNGRLMYQNMKLVQTVEYKRNGVRIHNG